MTAREPTVGVWCMGGHGSRVSDVPSEVSGTCPTFVGSYPCGRALSTERPPLTREPTIADRRAAAEELAELERRADVLGRRSHNIYTDRDMDAPWPELVTEQQRAHWRKHGLEMDKASRRDAAYEILEFVKENDR